MKNKQILQVCEQRLVSQYQQLLASGGAATAISEALFTATVKNNLQQSIKQYSIQKPNAGDAGVQCFNLKHNVLALNDYIETLKIEKPTATTQLAELQQALAANGRLESPIYQVYVYAVFLPDASTTMHIVRSNFILVAQQVLIEHPQLQAFVKRRALVDLSTHE